MMTYDPVDALAKFAARRRIAYRLLADPGSAAIRAFGLLDQRYPPNSWARGVALPIILVIDADGTVTHRFSDRNYWNRPPIERVLAVLRADAMN